MRKVLWTENSVQDLLAVDENIRELLIENYRAVYQVQATSVAILTIFESHRQLNIQSLQK